MGKPGSGAAQPKLKTKATPKSSAAQPMSKTKAKVATKPVKYHVGDAFDLIDTLNDHTFYEDAQAAAEWYKNQALDNVTLVTNSNWCEQCQSEHPKTWKHNKYVLGVKFSGEELKKQFNEANDQAYKALTSAAESPWPNPATAGPGAGESPWPKEWYTTTLAKCNIPVGEVLGVIHGNWEYEDVQNINQIVMQIGMDSTVAELAGLYLAKYGQAKSSSMCTNTLPDNHGLNEKPLVYPIGPKHMTTASFAKAVSKQSFAKSFYEHVVGNPTYKPVPAYDTPKYIMAHPAQLAANLTIILSKELLDDKALLPSKALPKIAPELFKGVPTGWVCVQCEPHWDTQGYIFVFQQPGGHKTW